MPTAVHRWCTALAGDPCLNLRPTHATFCTFVYWPTFKFIHHAQQEICDKATVTDPITLQRRCYTTLWTNSFPKQHWLKAQQWQTECTRTEEKVTVIDDMILKHYNQPQIHRSTHQIANSSVVCDLEVFKEDWLRESAAQTAAEWFYHDSVPW